MTHDLRTLSLLLSSLALVGGCFAADASTDADADAATETTSATDGSTGGDPADPDDGSDAGPGSSDGEDPDPADSTGADGEDTGSTTGEQDVCGPAKECLAPVPDGWEGPVALNIGTAGEEVPDCGGAFPNLVPLGLGADLDDGGAASCECGCAPGATSCDLEAGLSYWDPGLGNSCLGEPDGSIMVTDGTATSLPAPHWIDDPSGTWMVNYITQDLDGACVANPSANIPAPGFATEITVCALDVAAAECGDGGRCAPIPTAPFEAQTCVWQEGEHECTDAAYSTVHHYYREIEDTRACPDCTCGNVLGDCSDPTFTPGYLPPFSVFPLLDNETVPNDGSCNGHLLDNGQVHNVMSAEAGNPIGLSCNDNPAQEVPTGEVAPSGVVTLCCDA